MSRVRGIHELIRGGPCADFLPPRVACSYLSPTIVILSLARAMISPLLATCTTHYIFLYLFFYFSLFFLYIYFLIFYNFLVKNNGIVSSGLTIKCNKLWWNDYIDIWYRFYNTQCCISKFLWIKENF